jgi:hypothetical protein
MQDPSFITFIFSDTSHHDDHHPHPLFQRLYLGPQPRYKPSATSALSPTSVSTDGCPLITRLHCGFLLRNRKPTAARSQLFCAASSLFEAFASWTAILPLGPAFE